VLDGTISNRCFVTLVSYFPVVILYVSFDNVFCTKNDSSWLAGHYCAKSQVQCTCTRSIAFSARMTFLFIRRIRLAHIMEILLYEVNNFCSTGISGKILNK
jgi:hypothetical protein